MKENCNNNNLGNFSAFGITTKGAVELRNILSETLNITPPIIPLANNSNLFWFSNDGDITETANAVILKVGFIRSAAGHSLSSKSLIEESLVAPEDIKYEGITGNGFIACCSKLSPNLSIYKTFLSTKHLYYTKWQGGLFCSTSLRAVLKVSDQVTLNEKAIPMHFIFRLTPGPLTYFKNIWRLFSSEILTWDNGDLKTREVRSLAVAPRNPSLRIDSPSVNSFFEGISSVMAAYVQEIESGDYKLANELSGGVDSSIIQLLINRQLPPSDLSTFSFNWEAESFRFEARYAKETSDLLRTQHEFLNIETSRYPELLIKTIETLAQPDLLFENGPGQLALAQHLASHYPRIKYVFMGQAADALHGIGFAPRVALYDRLKHIPGVYFMRELASLLLPSLEKRRFDAVFKALSNKYTYSSLFAPRGLLDPTVQVQIPYVSIENTRRLFGNAALFEVFEYVQNLSGKHLKGASTLEKAQDNDLITVGFEPAARIASIFSSQQKELIPFYCDQEVIRLTRAFPPDIRFIYNKRTKPVLKSVLEQNSLGAISRRTKGYSNFRPEFHQWLRNGVLKEMVHSIERPGFITKKDFDDLMLNRRPFSTEFIWPLLTYDIFQKYVYKKL